MRMMFMGDAHFTSMFLRSRERKQCNIAFYQHIFQKFFAQEADYYVSLGDLTHYGLFCEYKQILSIINRTKKENQRFVPIAGNHDLYGTDKKTYQSMMGQKMYWAEDTPDAKLIFLDTVRAHHPGKDSGRMDEQQLHFLEKELQSAGTKLCVVMAHHPVDRVKIVDSFGNILPDQSLMKVLERKKGTGVYVNGHLHRDRYYSKANWGFLQFNDILDEPTIRVLNVKNGQVLMETVSLEDNIYREYATQIAKTLWTFRRTRNDEEFAKMRDLFLLLQEGSPVWGLVRATQRPHYSLPKRRLRLSMIS